MPIYEYCCDQCGHRFEKWQGYDADATHSCAIAGCTGICRRQFSAAPVLFKGKGFYVTDNAKSVPNEG